MNRPAALLLLAALLQSGCKKSSLERLSCEESSDPACPTKETCPGPCVPLPPLGWSLPVLLWSGPQFEAPECPADQASSVQYEGHADPNEPPECPSCSCEPPTAGCELPLFLTVSTQDYCIEDPLAVTYDFSGLDPDEICNTDNAMPAGLIKSLMVGPLLMTESGCKSVTTLLPKSGDAAWKTFARACGYEISPCLDPRALCVSTTELPSGFSQCIYRSGEHECPSGYPNRRVFYDEVNESRRCSECSCGAPSGGECSAYVRVYHDAMCTTVVAGYLLTSKMWCTDIYENSPLAGKTATTPVYEPGACEPSGGELIGSAELIGPSTFCCQ